MNATAQETELDLVVRKRTALTPEVAELVLASAAGGELPAWEPGSHVDLILREGLVRQYSLCGDPGERDVWRLAVLRERESRGGSRHVHDELTDGSPVRVRGPRNNFPLLPAARYRFVAGGIGITPIVPMIAAAEKAGARWQLLYGGRTRRSMAFAEQLTQAYGDKVILCPEDELGRLDLDSWLAEPRDDTLVYCCGPEPLLLAAEARCAAWRAGSLRLERFVPRAAPASAEEATFEVELTVSGLTVTVPPGKSVLKAVEEAGVRVRYSCEQGTCGTCETEVVAGTPEHRDSLLDEEERAEGKTMMICVSRAACPRLVLAL
ncbi:PDR/VanB family oxidoreductase [Amycolatopsis carbonis]|uniref:PDR/VanB family oxidoreductase n=1 Tax=Amycolatopsis carbonis TaxID=715471 RepID=A0A9Y2IM20_9PSEU|nr:PDR/VanB family oxidoreductase [Amycolatopsis sp. 2-15]WIX82820.1 PDR/VanB family oxidoreductase [Amycolatopsis sp. 2-15]